MGLRPYTSLAGQRNGPIVNPMAWMEIRKDESEALEISKSSSTCGTAGLNIVDAMELSQVRLGHRR